MCLPFQLAFTTTKNGKFAITCYGFYSTDLYQSDFICICTQLCNATFVDLERFQSNKKSMHALHKFYYFIHHNIYIRIYLAEILLLSNGSFGI